jgi:leader peptidase (prepilin peptidase)/N-methyltransferase
MTPLLYGSLVWAARIIKAIIRWTGFYSFDWYASAFLLPYPTPVQRIAGFLLPGLCLFLLAMRYGGVGGGDIKLTAAIGFCFGLNALAVILLAALFPACIYAKATRQRSVPLATFLCIGFFVYLGILMI